jgi:S-adenosylmethionine:tRNA ribosyltransferase-isomerase
VYRTSDFDFDLPQHLIAQTPAERRDVSRLLTVERSTGHVGDRVFSELPELIPPGDVLVLNETRVFPARLRGRRSGGGEAEILLLRPTTDDPAVWTAIVRPGSKLRPGRVVEIGPELVVEILDATPGGERVVLLETDLPIEYALERYGEVPLPPYVRRAPGPEDRERYQTVYARQSGSVAAPTAGLHFTPQLLEGLEKRGVAIARLVLHVGIGTFRPVEVEDPASHRMHAEWYQVPDQAADTINRARSGGGRVWAVGTTTVRTLESVTKEAHEVQSGAGWTDIFIRPPYQFRAVDRLITNFHLPRSTLLMLVAAFAGYDLAMEAYRRAIELEYRFFSYGDAMVIM